MIKRNTDYRDAIIAKQVDEIARLKQAYQDVLKAKEDQNSFMEQSIKELEEVITDLNEKLDRCNALIEELQTMKDIINKAAFNDKYERVRRLMK